MEPVPVLMQVDASINIPAGPVRLSLRSVALVLACSPLAFATLFVPLSAGVQIGGFVAVFALALIVSVPSAEGVWFGTLAAYRLADRWMPRLVERGRVGRARFRRLVGIGVTVERVRRPLPVPPPLHHWTSLARVADVGDSLFDRRPGGWHVVFELLGPDHGPQTEQHARWATNVVSWVRAVDCAAQFVCTSDHTDRAEAGRAFDARHRAAEWLLDQLERRWTVEMAETSLRIRNFVVFFPRLAGRDGMPVVCCPTRLFEVGEASLQEAVRVHDVAVRQADNLHLRLRPLPPDEVHELLETTLLETRKASLEAGLVEIAAESRAFLAALRLPPSIFPGSVVGALARAQVRGGLSLHLCPVESGEARRELRRQIAIYRELMRRSADSDAELLYTHAQELEGRLLSRTSTAFRAALSGYACGSDSGASLEALEKLQMSLAEERFQVERVTSPALAVAQATMPGGPPLRRSLLLIEDSVAACLLPAVGTPFSDPSQPLLGLNAMLGTTVYFDVFRQQNHNALIAGQSGAGKSVACKTMLLRHALQGAKVVVIDPDNEYRRVVGALGGNYFELGQDSLNAFDIAPHVPAKEAAEYIMGVLSVMGGEEQDYVNSHAIRGLRGSDKAWLETEVVQFFEDFRSHFERVPVLSDFVRYLELVSVERAKEYPQRAERCSDMVLRLRSFTQGRRAAVFDRPSSFDLSGPATGIGLYALANQMGADLAPALAFVLTALLGELEGRYVRATHGERSDYLKFIILVDEAHWVLQDPEAGKVLERLVRQARKRGAGVWMASQSVRDFVGDARQDGSGQPSLGEILATSASTKLILGIQDAVAEGARRTFDLSAAELDAVTGRRAQGQGVLISDSERAIVHVVPGIHLQGLTFTRPPLEEREAIGLLPEGDGALTSRALLLPSGG
jgi:hypothetical protein